MDSKTGSSRNQGHRRPSTQSRVNGEQANADSETSPVKTGGRGLRGSVCARPTPSSSAAVPRATSRVLGEGPWSRLWESRADLCASTVCFAEFEPVWRAWLVPHLLARPRPGQTRWPLLGHVVRRPDDTLAGAATPSQKNGSRPLDVEEDRFSTRRGQDAEYLPANQ